MIVIMIVVLWIARRSRSIATTGERTQCAPATRVQNDSSNQICFVSVHLLDGKRGEGSLFLVTLSWMNPPTVQEGRVRRMMEHFGLTPAEQRLTLFLTRGGHLMEAARTFSLSRHTVRNQLRSVFEKVGVRRQTDLTRLMCSSFQVRGLA